MSDVTLSVDEEAEVGQAVALLKLRQKAKGNPFKVLAVERKLKGVSERSLTLAQGRIDREPKKRPTVSASQATLQSVTLTTTLRNEPTVKGHNMNFEMKLDLPEKAKDLKFGTGEASMARDLYGVFFEWWEEIVQHYDFTEPAVDDTDNAAVTARNQRIAAKKASGEGGWEKPWSDIYLSNPQSQTFFSWKNSLEEAAKGTIGTGDHTTGVLDRPGINLGDNSFKKRTLRFRINAGDANGVVWKGDAIQVLVVEDGALTSSYYQDSAGGELKSGTGEVEPMRYRPKAGSEVRSEAAEFVQAVEGNKKGCSRFDNTELEQAQDRSKTSGIDLTTVHKDLNQSNRMNAVPLIPSSDSYWQMDASDGGLLVAHLSGKKVKRLFHTDNQPRDLKFDSNGVAMQVSARTFEQLPLD